MSDDTLSKPVNMSQFLSKPSGIKAKVAAAKEALKNIDPTKVENRLGIVFDDSGSMSGEAIKSAHTAVEGFSQSCNPKNTSISVHFLNHEPALPLTVDYTPMNVSVQNVWATGGTPLYSVSLDMLKTIPITRGVVFSDGAPNYEEFRKSTYPSRWNREDEEEGTKPLEYKCPKDFCIELAREKKVPFDTVYIGPSPNDDGAKELKDFAEKTGGIFLHFTDISVFRSNLKYLAPAHRALLANAELKEKIQRGEKI